MLAKDQPNPGVCDRPGMEVVLFYIRAIDTTVARTHVVWWLIL